MSRSRVSALFVSTGADACKKVFRCYSKAAASAAASNTAQGLRNGTFAVWAPNTDVGKTLICAALMRAAAAAEISAAYIKPIQTGFPQDSDGSFVARIASCEHSLGAHAAEIAALPASSSGVAPQHDFTPHMGRPHDAAQGEASAPQGQVPSVGSHRIAHTMFAWKRAVSPHLAIQHEGRGVEDSEVVSQLSKSCRQLGGAGGTDRPDWACVFVETAGGVCSPGPSGTLQADLLRPLRLPAILVADGRLGGISATLSAYESLLLRGYDVVAVTGFDVSGLDNLSHISRSLQGAYSGGPQPAFFPLPPCDPPEPGFEDTQSVDPALSQWLEASAEPMGNLLSHLRTATHNRSAALSHAGEAARQALWWPFTQHSLVGPRDVTVIDSRSGESYIVAQHGSQPQQENGQLEGGGTRGAVEGNDMQLVPLYDSCASWWTQGVSQQQAHALHRHLAYGAGRFSHVIYPEAVHEPALDLAERLLDLVGKGWASRVFYSDDGSTAIEVALKMAFRKYLFDAGMSPGHGHRFESLHVLALHNGYHGDTLGAMDCSPESVFNATQTPWYRAQGLFLDPPTCGMSKGRWQIRLPDTLQAPTPEELWFESLEALMSNRSETRLAQVYLEHISTAIDEHVASTGCQVGAAMVEALVQAAGGMRVMDPLFLTTLVETCRSRRIPVIADEVFSGLWRLGVPSVMQRLGLHPDVACFAKLLTGGTVPLAVTLATEDVFRSFQGDSKASALLHGHSYSAHPIGCQVSIGALRLLHEHNTNILDGSDSFTSLWDQDRVSQLSHLESVDRVVAMGTLLALELRVDGGGGGYASTAAKSVTSRLRQRGVYARPLGNVVYLMCTPTSSQETTGKLLNALETCLNEVAQARCLNEAAQARG